MSKLSLLFVERKVFDKTEMLYSIPHMPTIDLTKLPKEQIISQLDAAYARAKPVNDQMVDISMEIQGLTAEIYRRTILKNFGIEPEIVNCVLSIGCNVHHNKGVPELVRRVAELKAAGIIITKVQYNKNLNEYRFFAENTPSSDEPTSNE
jgi:uncharacterized membrane protein YfbV (UPF0208 family)